MAVGLLAGLAGAVVGQPHEVETDLPGGAKMAFVWIEPGTFTMGTTDAQRDSLRQRGLWSSRSYGGELPAHQVELTQGFYLGKHEITQGQWTAVTGQRPWSGREEVLEDTMCPAVFISVAAVRELVHRLNEAVRDSLFRLPTEAEWEYACRAGNDGLWSVPEGALRDYAWYGASSTRVSELDPEYRGQRVGEKLPNPWGLYDMHGNVFEWVEDRYAEYTAYTAAAQVDPVVLTGSAVVMRGGCFGNGSLGIRSAVRSVGGNETSVGSAVGARLVYRGGQAASMVVPTAWGSVKAGSAPSGQPGR
jgi:formylglycine-generating enzyme required for sulfatase activity